MVLWGKVQAAGIRIGDERASVFSELFARRRHEQQEGGIDAVSMAPGDGRSSRTDSRRRRGRGAVEPPVPATSRPYAASVPSAPFSLYIGLFLTNPAIMLTMGYMG